MSGVLKPDFGISTICGYDITTQSLHAQSCFGYLPEAAAGFSNLTVREFLTYCGESREMWGKRLAVAIEKTAEQIELLPAIDQEIRKLSKGWRQRAWLAQAILHDPPVLMLDEPTDGLDPNQKHEVRKLITEMGEAQGKAIVLSTHILEEVEAVCTRAVIINKGKVVADDTPEALRAMAPAGVAGNPMDHVFRSVTSGELEEIGA